MIQITKIEGIVDCYPEEIIGTKDWYACKECKESFCDLYEAEEIVQLGHTFAGANCRVVHYPEGTVHSPFSMKENVYVECPVWNNGELDFLVVDFNQRIIQIFGYIPETKKLNEITALPLDEVKDCYNLMLKVSPLTLIRQGNDEVCEIVWPENKKISIGKTESLMFRDEKELYFSEWYEDPEYHENVVIRDWVTGAVKERFEGQLCRLPNGVYWRI